MNLKLNKIKYYQKFENTQEFNFHRSIFKKMVFQYDGVCNAIPDSFVLYFCSAKFNKDKFTESLHPPDV